MMDIAKVFETVQVAIVVADADYIVTYANEKCKQVFKDLLGAENFVGKNMNECHKPETVEKLARLFDEYKAKSRSLDYYTMDLPDGGKATIVNVPYYDGETFRGVVEFVFESSLA